MTAAARKFVASAKVAWDSREPWERTAAEGLADVDHLALVDLCRETGEDVHLAEVEVMGAVREHVESMMS